MKGFTRPLKISCADHESGGPVIFQQWDGSKWSFVSNWVPVMKDIVRPMIEEAAAKFAKRIKSLLAVASDVKSRKVF